MFEIPPTELVVTEHQAYSKICPACQHRNSVSFPAEVTSLVQYGASVGARAVYLLQYQRLPYRRNRT